MSHVQPMVLLTPAEKAAELQITEKTLKRMRDSGVGPRFIRVGSQYRYLPFTMEIEIGGEGELNRAVLAKAAKTRLRQTA